MQRYSGHIMVGAAFVIGFLVMMAYLLGWIR